ncbi:hypothetical protein DENIT_20091 [Pseudomonas veronii]|nr:hypothetical protein [Pseudomonas veronii]CAD0264204.1 hypothetical protein DENIT_20091 [Pseudomonas veronii]
MILPAQLVQLVEVFKVTFAQRFPERSRLLGVAQRSYLRVVVNRM